MASESDSRKRRPIETLIAEWDVLFSLLRGQSQHPFPTNEEIKSSISKTEADLRQRDEEIQHLQAQIIILENEKRLIERSAVGYKSLLAPIRKLSPELLHQIFLLVCDENFTENSLVRIPPAILVQVCSSWNGLATSSSRLWSTITWWHFDWEPEPPRSRETVLEHLLEKSGSAPLRVEVAIGELISSSTLRCIDMLVRQSHRWLRFSLHFELGPELYDDLCRALHPIQGNLPFLEHLEFDADFQRERILDVFQDAPRLCSVVLRYEYPNDIILPWEQLQSLVLSRSKNSYAPLRLSSKLRTLTIDSHMKDNSEVPDPASEIIFDAEAFSLCLDPLESALDIIANLTLPKLTSLTVFSEFVSDTSPLSLRSLIFRSSCTLTSLTWSGLRFPVEPFLSFLSTVPSLASLTLSDKSKKEPTIAQGLIDKLHIRFFSSIDIFLPNLQTLSLSSMIEEPCLSDASLVDAIVSRWLPNGGVAQCLRSIRLETPRRRFTANIMPLQQLAQAGMKIVIKDQAGIVLC